MLLETYNGQWDYQLLDTGNGFRLEKWGEVILQRPDPQIIWQPSQALSEWDKAWATFRPSPGDDKGKWDIKKSLPKKWVIKFDDVQLLLKLSPFKHTGIFGEQAAQWEWMVNRLKMLDTRYQSKEHPYQQDRYHLTPRILNLFAYTGGATMVLAKHGCQVTHVDASKPTLTWANENHTLNKLPKDSVRWILDDVVKFVKREIKRGGRYDGIILDPPAFGHSPSGKTWKFNYDIPGLLADCVSLLSNDAKFLLLNAYATNSSALAINNLLEDGIKTRGGKIESGELCLKQKSGRMISTGIFARWSKG